MKFLIIGLGNPGSEYADTRHNIGFQVLDALRRVLQVSSSPQRATATMRNSSHKGRTFILIKPATFMNLSGKAVRYWMEQEKMPSRAAVGDHRRPSLALRCDPHQTRRWCRWAQRFDQHHRTDWALMSSRDCVSVSATILPVADKANTCLGSGTKRNARASRSGSSWPPKPSLQFGLLGIDQAMNGFNKR